ncbi:hypothetical protein AS9A_0602 [Hoyosella subflava DQS3-9A1]|uniref:Uncharacterized protein n=1 Tax=Hoyosella subflava (strain DSM 45089 / JCM 17490 / NBRC 109087 / DQS3-9A1) TaxID=443218 RepID=F6EJK7_HOYSD|nr:hypothetical protein AS9A_0602 [Hoyosella subflava DQS3-9A1]
MAMAAGPEKLVAALVAVPPSAAIARESPNISPAAAALPSKPNAAAALESSAVAEHDDVAEVAAGPVPGTAGHSTGAAAAVVAPSSDTEPAIRAPLAARARRRVTRWCVDTAV